MTNPNKTDITFILDRSGSMLSVWDDTINGLRSFVEEQADLPGVCKFTLVTFDNHYEVPIANKYIGEVFTILNDLNIQPRGLTALYHSVGKTIDNMGERFKNLKEEDRPGKVILVVATDGQNNQPSQYSKRALNNMIKHQQDKYNWEVIYTGVGIDITEEAVDLGIKLENRESFPKTKKGIYDTFSYVGQTVSSYRVDS